MKKTGRWLALFWRRLLLVCFLLLCLRFLTLALYGSRTNIWPPAVLFLAFVSLACWRPGPSLFAFIASILLVNGLAQAAFLNFASSLSLLFSSLFLGLSLRDFGSAKSTKTEERSAEESPVIVGADILASAILLSLAVELWRHRDSLGFLLFEGEQATYGYGSPHYFLTSAFLWLQGLFFFRTLLIGRLPQINLPAALNTWAKPVFIVYGFTLAVFFLFQFVSNIPKPLVGYAYYLPCEDISSFGSICVAVLVFFVAQLKKDTWPKWTLAALCLGMLLIMTIASWSRATWFAAVAGLLTVAWFRARRRWFLALVGIGALAFVIINLNARRESWLHNPYLARLIALLRLEDPARKSPERIFLYHKAADILRVHPIVGVGIGSFYLSSRLYARKGDPNGTIPDFAHNAFLQVAVELGLPVAALFVGLVAFAIVHGIREVEMDRVGDAMPTNTILLGTTLALGVYVLTQLTANSLNVYSTNQFVFWFLMAMPLAGHSKLPRSFSSGQTQYPVRKR